MAIVNQHQKNQVSSLVKLQAISVMILFIILFAFFGIYDSGSALIGSLISLIANFCSIQRLFAGNSYEPKKILGQLYIAEVLKVVITVTSFIIVFKYLSINYLFFIIGYTSAVFSFWVAPLLVHKIRPLKLNKITVKPEAEQPL